MKKLTKSLIITSVVGTIGLGGLATAGIASAATTTNSGNPMSSLVDKIASTFNLDKTKVQALFDADRTAHEAERKQQTETNLAALVTAGTITSAQKTAIETEIAKLDAERQADKTDMSTLTDEQRKAKMGERKSELDSWASSQGLDLSKLKGVFGGPGGAGGHGGPGM